MKTNLRRSFSHLILAVSMAVCGMSASSQTPPAGATPALRSLEVDLTVVRFKPSEREMILEDLRLPKGASNAVEYLRSKARVVDVLYRSTRSAVLAGTNVVRFDATENRPVVLVGKVGQTPPPSTAYGLTLQLTVQPVANDCFALSLDGQLIWSPDLLDHRLKFNEVMSFLGKTATAAGGVAGQLKSGETDTLKQATGIGLAVAELFKQDKTGDSAIYELPVTKTVAISSSRYCRSGESIVITTSSEASVNAPQSIVMILEPNVRVQTP